MRSRKFLVIVSAGLMMGMLVTLAAAKKRRSIANGQWGGNHVRMTVADGSATIEYDCANGTINGPLRLDSRGRFSLKGTHVREHGAAVRMGEDDNGAPALYTGWTDGKTMKLTVTLINPKTDLGTFQLTRGNAGRVFKCL